MSKEYASPEDTEWQNVALGPMGGLVKNCEYAGCLDPIENPRAGQRFCSSPCRLADWRDKHEPRCPNCGAHITVSIAFSGVQNAVILGVDP